MRTLAKFVSITGISCLFLCCQGGTEQVLTHADLIEILRSNEGIPYSVQVEEEEHLARSNSKGDFLVFKQTSSHIFQDEASSCDLLTWDFSGFPTESGFSFRSGGVEHITQKEGPDDSLAWDCRVWEDWPMPESPLVIYPGKGRNLFLQARLLLEDLGAGQIAYLGDEAEISWFEFPEGAIDEMSRVFGTPLSDSNELKELKLRINITHGQPTLVGFYFEGGDSNEVKFIDFIFFEGDFLVASHELEANLGVPDSFSCECDYSNPSKRGEWLKPKLSQ